MNYKRLNDIGGWLVFAISLVVFWMTMAPTASFWDCGEFISCANELEVPHPPGPPVYLLIGRMLAVFASGPETVAYMVNLASVFSSAFTVLFIFWSITLLGRKLILEAGEEPDSGKTILLLMAGAVGSLACAFSDSFWFNAVEAEVYAMSSLCTAVVVWLMLKWEVRAEEKDQLRWIVLIAYVVGLSISVHLLNLLAIPGLALMYYFRKYTFSWTGLLVTLGISVAILGMIQKGVIQYSMELAWLVEKMLVGTVKLDGSYYSSGMGLPQGSGLVLFSLLLGGLVAGGIWYSIRRNIAWLNASLVSFATIMIGYSTYMVIGIRANADTPINENDPGNVASMLSYMRREQYGDNPLLTGPLYNVNPGDPKNGVKLKDTEKSIFKWKSKGWFLLEDGSYTLLDGTQMKVAKGKTGVASLPEKAMLKDSTPVRINPSTKVVQAFYQPKRYVWDDYKKDYDYPSRVKVTFPRMHSSSHYDKEQHNFGYERYVKNRGSNPDDPFDDKPTSAENMAFFWDYQVLHMYWRYFGWNFVGRMSDIQDEGVEAGWPWETSDMPEFMKKDPSKNHYFALPLLLGILGMAWQFLKRNKDATVLMVLFFFTGLAIIIYLNQTPSQPRERDYSYVGSFQTFCIWIGLGVIALYELLVKYLKKSTPVVVGLVSLLAVPVVMAAENWKDHSRHYQYVPPDSAYNLLMSCKPNALLFTNGDNDTFPLWYLQEVEGIRTDVRVVNLSLLNTDWYIDQMRKQSNLSAPLPISVGEEDYRGDINNTVYFKPNTVVTIPVDREKVLANGTVPKEWAYRILPQLNWTVRIRGGGQNTYILKQDFMILDIVKTNAARGWERPIYFSSTIPSTSYMDLTQWFQAEGLAYRLMPISERPEKKWDPYPAATLDIERTYTLLIDTFRYRNLNNPNLYLDEHIRKTIVGNLNNTFYRLINVLMTGSKTMEAENSQSSQLIENLRKAGNNTVADSLSREVQRKSALITDYRKKAKSLLDFRQEKIPYQVIEMDPVLMTFLGRAYSQLGEKEKAAEYFDYSTERVLGSMEYYASHNMKEKMDERDKTAVMIVAEFYKDNNEIQKAIPILQKLFNATNDPRVGNELQQYQMKAPAESKPPVNDSAGK